MAGAKHRLFSAFRFSRKLALITGGVLVLLGASGTAALVFSGPKGLMGLAEGEASDAATGSCKTIYQAKFMRAGERRLTAIVSVTDGKPDQRIAVGLQMAEYLAKTEKPDLVTLLLSDKNGPDNRAELRGPTIGVEIAYAPNPNRSRATAAKWDIRYIDAEPSELGYYFGDRVTMAEPDIEHALGEVHEFDGCDGDKQETASAEGGHGEAAGHGETASHGEPSGHDAAPAPAEHH